MTKNLKKALVLVLAMLMVVAVFAGCAQKAAETTTTETTTEEAVEETTEEATEEAEEATEEATEEAEPETAIDTSELVTVSHVVLGDPDSNDNWKTVQEKWNEYLESKINTHMELYWTGWTDYLTKYNLMLASGEELDMVDSASDWLDLWPNAARGAWLVLDEYIPVYSPLTWAEVSETSWEACKYNGQIICYPEDCYAQWVNHGFMYRGDWADEAGVSDINSFDDLEVYFQWVVDNKSDEGVTPWNDHITSGTGIFGGWLDAVKGYYSPDLKGSLYTTYADPSTIVAPMLDDELMMEFATTMRRWYVNGYYPTDVLTDVGNDNRADMEAGISSVDQHHTETYVGEVTTMEEKQPGSDLRFFAWCEQQGTMYPYPVTHGCLAISVNTKHADRCCMVYEMQRQDETFVHYYMYGIEGWQYEINEDGLRTTPEDYDSDKDGFWTNIWSGRPDKYLINSTTTWEGKDACYEYMSTFSTPNPYGGWIKNTDNLTTQISAVDEVINSLFPAIAGGMIEEDQLQSYIDTLQDQLLAAGLQDMIDDYQTQLTAYMG